MSEFDRIRLLHHLFAPAPDHVIAGIGDDAAVLDLPHGSRIVWTVDSSVELIHFRRDLVGCYDIGWRSMMAAASDLAAMAAEPLGALSALMLPADWVDDDLLKLAQGQNDAARSIGSAVIGGNLARASELSISTTWIGSVATPCTRAGARVGDVVVVAGQVGWAAAGLQILLRQGNAWDRGDELVHRAVRAWQHPVALIRDGRVLGQVASAMIDVSDGLAADAGHIAVASGVAISIDPDLVRDDAFEALCASQSIDPLATMLGGGEDYALIACVDADCAVPNARIIGRCERGEGVWFGPCCTGRRVDGLGHDHFASKQR